jgi:transposase InsO family protein
MGIAVTKDTMAPPVRFANGKTAPCYGIHRAKCQVKDWEGRKEKYSLEYYIIDLEDEEYQAVLGRQWLAQADPDIILSAGAWRYRNEAPLIKIEDPARFAKSMRTNLTMMIMYRPDADDDGKVGIPKQYHKWYKVFSEGDAAALPGEQAVHEIPLVPGSPTPPYGPLYSLSQTELQTLREYLDKMLARGWIQPSQSAAGAPVLFVRKPDGSLRLCVDYRGLNALTVKNRYPLPRIDELMDRLVGAKFFTKLDLRDAYHRIRIKRGDEWKTAFRCRYGHYEYKVMPFGLCNAPATFQSYINTAMKGILDDFCVVYLDDILIFSETEEEHERHVGEVLERLRKHDLYAKLSKCSFHQEEVHFLGFIVGRNGIRIDPGRSQAVNEWPEPRSFHDIQVFLGFTGYFRRFISHYARITAPLTDMLKGMKRGRKSGRFHLSERGRDAFRQLKDVFTRPPTLQHYDPSKPILLITDASGYAIAGILLQPAGDGPADSKLNPWQPVAFYSRKLQDAERRYEVHDQELLAIVECFKEWRHYLEGGPHAIRVQTDHNNLKYFFKTKVLNQRQARWAELLAAYDFQIEYKPGHLNPADAPSRRWDYEPESKETNSGLLPTLQRKLAGTGDGRVDAGAQASEGLVRGQEGPELLSLRVLSREAGNKDGAVETLSPTLRQLILQAQFGDARASRLRDECSSRGGLEDRRSGDPEGDGAPTGRWRVDGGLLLHGEAVYVPSIAAIRQEILRIHHDDPSAGHFGRERTLELLRRKFYWDRMRNDVAEYVGSCAVCQKTKVPRRLPAGELNSLPVPHEPWQDLTMDFITGLPPSSRGNSVYDAIFVVVDRFTKAARYIPTTKSLNAEELADIFLTEIVFKTGSPRSLVSDRGSLFTSSYWTQFCQTLRIKGRMSTAFHPQTDGQTERQNQTLEAYLRVYTNFRQSDWVSWLGMAEFAYNNTKNESTGYSPFMAWQGRNPALPGLEDIANTVTNVSLEDRLNDMVRIREQLKENLQHAIEAQARGHAKRHRPVTFHVGQQVLLATKNLKTYRPSKKLDNRYEGPFTITETVGKQAYRLRLSGQYSRINPVFHVSLLKEWTGRVGENPPGTQPILVNGEEEWEVEAVVGERVIRNQRQYLVKWKDWPDYENSWQSEEDLENAKESIKEYRDSIEALAVPRRQRRPTK